MLSTTAIMDASSAIILCKSGLHSYLTRIYDIVLAESVFGEITRQQYTGSEEFQSLADRKKIRIQSTSLREGSREGMESLDAGEKDTIQLYYRGLGDFIIIDDGVAAKYCQKAGIPFINALLFPVVLKFAQIEDDRFCRRAMEQVVAQGRYSQHIIDFAHQCPRESIAFAIPEIVA